MVIFGRALRCDSDCCDCLHKFRPGRAMTLVESLLSFVRLDPRTGYARVRNTRHTVPPNGFVDGMIDPFLELL